MIANAKLNLFLDVERTQHELNAFEKKWSEHLNTAHYNGGWNVLSLRSPGGRDTPMPDLMGEENFENNANMIHFASVNALIASLKCTVMSVRFLNLQAGSEIRPHRDHDLAFEMGEARLHFPVITNERVEFYIDHELLKMNEGECWYINANLEHEVANKGETDRIHLVIDCKVNDWIKEVFNKGEISEKAYTENQAHTKHVIEELRLQNTLISNQLADKLERESFS